MLSQQNLITQLLIYLLTYLITYISLCDIIALNDSLRFKYSLRYPVLVRSRNLTILQREMQISLDLKICVYSKSLFESQTIQDVRVAVSYRHLKAC